MWIINLNRLKSCFKILLSRQNFKFISEFMISCLLKFIGFKYFLTSLLFNKTINLRCFLNFIMNYTWHLHSCYKTFSSSDHILRRPFSKLISESCCQLKRPPSGSQAQVSLPFDIRWGLLIFYRKIQLRIFDRFLVICFICENWMFCLLIPRIILL